MAALLTPTSPPPPPPPLLHHHHRHTSTTKPYQNPLPTPPTSSSSSSALAAAIDACTHPLLAPQIHCTAIKTAYFSNQPFLQTRLLFMHARCSALHYALHLFDTMPQRTLHSWLALLSACVDRSLHRQALLLFRELLLSSIALEFFVFPVALKACGAIDDIELGRALHAFALKTGFVSNIYVGNALIDMYTKCGLVDEGFRVLEGMHVTDRVSWNCVLSGLVSNGLVFDAVELLRSMRARCGHEPNLVSWSAAMAGLARNGHDEEALELLRDMLASGVEPNVRLLASILPSCGRLQELRVGKEIHAFLARRELLSNPFAVNGLIDVYRRCGDMVSARELFERFSVRSLASYNTMIVGYCEHGEPNEARAMFDRMEELDGISWNSMISGYSDNGEFEKGLKLFRDMLEHDSVNIDSFTLGSVLSCVTALAAARPGKAIHAYAIARDLHANPFVGSALVEMYSQCHDLVSAESAFFDIDGRDATTWNVLISNFAQADWPSRAWELLSLMESDGFVPNIYTWNGLIAGYLENGHDELALQMFTELQTTGLRPDIYTISMMVPVCSRSISIGSGKQIHAYSIRCRYDTNVRIGAALVDMYAKCGAIALAKLTFTRISQHNLVSFNTMLAGFAMHGLVEEGVVLFDRILEEGVRPDAVTFLSVLSLCVHGGSCEEGLRYFNMMVEYCVTPELKHYTSMVDMFSRAGRLGEACRLIRNMPMEPDVVVWGTLLGGCVVHGNVELGETAATKILELERGNAGNYVVLANLYARTGRRADLARARGVIRERGMQKIPGRSWIEQDGQVHVFIANDSAHDRIKEIYDTVKALNSNMRDSSPVV